MIKLDKRGKKYEIYNVNTGEVYTWGFNSFVAVYNLAVLKNQFGEKNVAIRWINK